jgi:hypothetical protein
MKNLFGDEKRSSPATVLESSVIAPCGDTYVYVERGPAVVPNSVLELKGRPCTAQFEFKP